MNPGDPSCTPSRLLWPPDPGALPWVIAGEDKREWGERICRFLQSQGAPWDRCVAFATSGSSGGGIKAVLFFPEALEASARAVNAWIGADLGGDWCCPLPVWHMGGFMIHVRARLSGSRVFTWTPRWNPEGYAAFLADCGASWSSLVPAQVVDLVRRGVKAPACIRCIIVGGGALDPETGELARGLGWPVVQSYGMTESASQVATARLDEPYTGRDLPVLPHWETRVTEEGFLALKGPARFCAYVHTGPDGALRLESFAADDWWTSKDRGECRDGRFTFLRRGDRVIKILGELVDLDALEARLSVLLPGTLICPLEDARRGFVLYACSPRGGRLSAAVEIWNREEPGLFRLAGYVETEIPLNPMGKLDRRRLAAVVAGRV